MSTSTATPAPPPPSSIELEDLIASHRSKLAFLAEVFCQPIATHCTWELSQHGQDGLYYILRDLCASAEKMDQINTVMLSINKEGTHA